MTVEKAIEEVQFNMSHIGLDARAARRVREAKKMAIQALERQIPKKVYHFTDDDTFETSCCGTDVTNKDYKYCPECGQLLGEVEEVEEDEII